ncbi:MAG: FKBP-type peptidyl-prolyl cis-trans isomerase [Prevotella sp.]|nr:FKBP-type peptidyl-prolyl cis-trans isomerase [Prevotella sp.]
MKTVNIMVKGWVKVLPFYLFTLLPLLCSCSEAEEEDEEYADWQNRNETYFEGQYQAHSVQSATQFVLPSWAQASSKSVSEVEHTKCVLVDVLKEGVGPESLSSPFYTDTVLVNYSGRLMPTVRYPSGYLFDSSYLTTYDPDVDVPYQTAVNLNSMVEGFSTALQHMHRGDQWRVTIPYQLGYGTTAGTSIPAYSTLVFEIELVDFWSKEEGDRD